MKFAELVRGASLRGSPSVFTSVMTMRLGRAVATLLRRRSDARGPLLVARGADGHELNARDGLVAGLLQSGVDVVDLGRAESDLFTFALRREGALGGVLIGTTGDSVGAMVFSGTRPVVGETLTALAAIADEGCFVVGAGQLDVRDLRVVFRETPPAQRHIEVDS